MTVVGNQDQGFIHIVSSSGIVALPDANPDKVVLFENLSLLKKLSPAGKGGKFPFSHSGFYQRIHNLDISRWMMTQRKTVL
ncbi:MAG: hypothetical protein KAJ19_20495, partial [Gammaproteobacteria bacterium]|nr:hypothetical protein [Gammaproteobacteria bacterium]